MKRLAAILLLCALPPANALAADETPNTALFGAWAVDTSRLPMPPAARPRSVTLTFSAAGKGHVRIQVAIVDPAGEKREADGVTPLDGTPTQLAANFEADASATLMPRPEVLILQMAKDGSPASTRIYAVNPDGDSMIETVAYFDAEGRPKLRKNYFTRLR